MKSIVIIAIVSVLLIPISAYADPHTIDTVNDSGLNLECGADCYTPKTLTVDVGHTITMTNSDVNGVHTFTSGTVYGFTPIPDGEFDSGILMQGDSFEFISNIPDVYPYYCTLHVWMQGTIIVVEAETANNLIIEQQEKFIEEAFQKHLELEKQQEVSVEKEVKKSEGWFSFIFDWFGSWWK